jgi:hypothetical protein
VVALLVAFSTSLVDSASKIGVILFKNIFNYPPYYLTI